MLSKWFSSVDFGKLAVDTSSGFIVTAALLLVVDAFSPAHLAVNILADKSAGYIVVSGLVIIVGSSILGIMVDSLFHTFGRWFARVIWPNLGLELEYRDCLMQDLGLQKDEFEWVQSTGTNLSAEVEKNYMRYTEIAGSCTYATMFLSAALALFLSWEYNQPQGTAIGVAAFTMLPAMILLFTSAASLEKYESNKTAAAMDEIRKLSSHLCTEKKHREGRSKLSPKSLWSLLLFVPFITAWSMVAGVSNPSIAQDNLAIISVREGDDIPVISVNATGNVTSPGTFIPVDFSKLISLDGAVYHGKALSLEGADASGAADITGLADLPEDPGWRVQVKLGRSIVERTVCLNARLSFDVAGAGELDAGAWLLPVIVTDDSGTRYLLAYIRVSISGDQGS